jgi:hypothetical protein
MDEKTLPVPLHVTIELAAHDDDDRLEHEIRLGVVGVPEPLTVRIESNFYVWPRIKQYCSCGGINLPQRLLDLLIFKWFEILSSELGEWGTDIVEWTVPDATRWIEVEFLTREAEIILAELRRHVTPGLEVDGAGRVVRLPSI